jgi:hypothetical protein
VTDTDNGISEAPVEAVAVPEEEAVAVPSKKATAYIGEAPTKPPRKCTADECWRPADPYIDLCAVHKETDERTLDRPLRTLQDMIDNPGEPTAALRALMASHRGDVYATQMGGAHYRDQPVQSGEMLIRNGVTWAEGEIVQHILRWKKRGGLDDLYKVRQYVEMIIQEAEANASD